MFSTSLMARPGWKRVDFKKKYGEVLRQNVEGGVMLVSVKYDGRGMKEAQAKEVTYKFKSKRVNTYYPNAKWEALLKVITGKNISVAQLQKLPTVKGETINHKSGKKVVLPWAKNGVPRGAYIVPDTQLRVYIDADYSTFRKTKKLKGIKSITFYHDALMTAAQERAKKARTDAKSKNDPNLKEASQKF
jgi:hypothetical protein